MTQAATAAKATRDATANAPTAAQITQSAFFATVYNSDLASVFFSLSEFAESAMIYHSVSRTWSTYSVLFDDPKTSLKFGGDMGVTELRPQIQVAEMALLYPVQKADRVMIRGVSYVVEDIDADGVGVVTVFLRRR